MAHKKNPFLNLSIPFSYLVPDNIDTRTVLMTLKELVSQSNAYISKKSSDQSANRGVLKNVAVYITDIFDILGLVPTQEQIGFPAASAAGAGANVRILSNQCKASC